MNKSLRRLVVILFGAAILAGCQPEGQPGGSATLVIETFEDARIWTGDPENPWAEAIAIEGDRILAVGSRREIAIHSSPRTERNRIARGLVVPGFIDTHVHFVDGGEALASVQLRDAKTPGEFT